MERFCHFGIFGSKSVIQPENTLCLKYYYFTKLIVDLYHELLWDIYSVEINKVVCVYMYWTPGKRTSKSEAGKLNTKHSDCFEFFGIVNRLNSTVYLNIFPVNKVDYLLLKVCCWFLCR